MVKKKYLSIPYFYFPFWDCAQEGIYKEILARRKMILESQSKTGCRGERSGLIHAQRSATVTWQMERWLEKFGLRWDREPHCALFLWFSLTSMM